LPQKATQVLHEIWDAERAFFVIIPRIIGASQSAPDASERRLGNALRPKHKKTCGFVKNLNKVHHKIMVELFIP